MEQSPREADSRSVSQEISSLLCKPTTGPYPDESNLHTISLQPILMLFSNLRLRFLSDLIPSEFMIKIPHAFHISPMSRTSNRP
jgi:hypothetical protein